MMIGAARGAGWWLCMLLVARAVAQDLDTAIFAESSKQTSVLDAIEDRRERESFIKLYREHNALARRSLAAKFLADYPASWLLAQVYEIAAKACIDLNDGECALRMGEQSLRLLPENPLLLVPLANVQIQHGLFAQALESASAALDLLDRFAAPAGTQPGHWTKLKRELRTSSYYARGRVYATQGLDAAGESRGTLLQQALSALREAAALSPDDPEPVYLRGLVQLALGRREDAIADFRFAAVRNSPVQGRAQDQLKKLNSREETVESRNPPAPSPPQTQQPAAGYAGSEQCKTCHAREFEAWRQTGMAKMLRPYRPENVIGDFTSQNQFAGPAGDPVVRMKVEHNRHVFEIRAEHGTWRRYPVDYTIGSKWQQAYATRLADGRIQVFPIQYNALKRKWINYWQLIDPAGSERADVASFYKMPASANFQSNCAPCHTSQLHSGGLDEAGMSHASFQEGGINCEMCHGPAASHATAVKDGGTGGKPPLEPPVNFARIGNRDAVAICAQCHMQSAIRDQRAKGEFIPHYSQRPYSEFLRKAFYKDGRFRETTFIVESFMRSACFRKGQAQCGNCHNPHLSGEPKNYTSLKFASTPDEMCLQCHEQYRNDPARHTHHRASSEGARCQACHMPRIMNSLLFQARSHQIDDRPDADGALRFGPAESPLACLECHPTRDALWVKTELRLWSRVPPVQASNAAP